MAVQKSAWFDDLKHGDLYERAQSWMRVLRGIYRLTALQIIILGSVVFACVHCITYKSTDGLKNFFDNHNYPDGSPGTWILIKALETLNVDGCLDVILESVMSGAAFVVCSGLVCLFLGAWRSKRLDIVCLIVLFLCLIIESKDLKNFDNALTSMQNDTMRRMRKSLLENQMTLGADVVASLDYVMTKGNCCGVIGGSDMAQLKHVLPRHKDGIERWANTLPLGGNRRGHAMSTCWTIPNQELTNVMGCYIHFFELSVRPFFRVYYGLVVLAQVILFTLLALQMEVPTNKDEALRVMFCNRKPTPFPDD